MYALSRDGRHVFLHDPAGGLAVPLLLHLTDSRIEIRMPPIDDLADHYIDHSSVRALKDATRDRAALIDATVAFGRFYTDRFHDAAYGDHVSLRELRTMIQRDYERVGVTADEHRFAFN